MTPDIRIYGQGFYSIFAVSESGVSWITENVPDSIEGAVYCDSTQMSSDIAEGATRDGLVVTVNDVVLVAGAR